MSVRKELDDYLAAMTEAGEKGDPTYHWLFLHGFKHALEMVDAYWSGDQPVSSQPERPNIESIHRPTPPPAAVPLPRGVDTDAYAKALKTLVKRFEATGPVGSAALILMATWEAVEGEPVSMSRVATFVDMAAMVVEDACPHEAWEVDGRGTRTRCVDCRTWLGPIGGE